MSTPSNGAAGGDCGDFDSLRTVFKEVLVPLEAICQGDDALEFTSFLAFWFCAEISCCCFLRSFWESFWGGVFIPAASLAFWAERLIDKFDVRFKDACAMISLMSNLVAERAGEDQVLLASGGV